MSTSIAQNIEALCQEQGIDRELVVEAIKEAVRAAAKKQFKGGEDIQVDWSPESGLELSASKVVVDDVADPSTELSIEQARELGGDEVEIGDALLLPMPMEELGRIAAQTAKQILFQKVRDAVRSNVYEQYIDRVGELVNGFVKRFERGNMIVDLGNLEAILPRSQQSRAMEPGRAHSRRHHQRFQGIKRAANRGFAHVAGIARALVRNGSARNLRRHRGDQILRARAG